MNNFEALTNEDRKKMLQEIGLQSQDDLYSNLPKDIKKNILNLPEPMSELEVSREIKKLASRNKTNFLSFLGGGASQRFIPACVQSISERFEFNTAYTPYQAEISQGTLQAIYEYQSVICNLTNMDVANASMYDCATAIAEAMITAQKFTKRNKCVIDTKAINPQYIEVIKTYAEASDIELSTDIENIDDNTIACVITQYPSFTGEINSLDNIKEKLLDEKTLLISIVDPMALTIIEPPKCDIIVGELQQFGNTVSFGGAYAGFFACLDKYKRHIPGRIVGKTTDKEGNTAFCLTLQTREQHIRREKATSNICSNQSLVALQSLIYVTVLGNKGLKQIAAISAKNAHYLAQRLESKGFEIENKNFLNEFVLKTQDAKEFLENLKENNIIGGLQLDETRILVCTTELHTKEDLDRYEYFAV